MRADCLDVAKIKDEIKKAPLFGHALLASRNIFVDRSDRQKGIASTDRGMDRLPAGVGALFFAEATRSTDGRLPPFKKRGFAASLMERTRRAIAANRAFRVFPGTCGQNDRDACFTAEALGPTRLRREVFFCFSAPFASPR